MSVMLYYIVMRWHCVEANTDYCYFHMEILYVNIYKFVTCSMKIIEGLAPNFSNPTTSTFSGRRGRSCIISHVNVGRVGTLSYNSFRWRSIRLFNSLPMHLRSISSCSVLGFKTQT